MRLLLVLFLSLFPHAARAADQQTALWRSGEPARTAGAGLVRSAPCGDTSCAVIAGAARAGRAKAGAGSLTLQQDPLLVEACLLALCRPGGRGQEAD